MSKGSYDLAGMRSAATKIKQFTGDYENNQNKIVEKVNNTSTHTDDPIIQDYIRKFEDLKSDMESVRNLMNAYSDYLEKAAKVIEEGTTPQ